VEVIGQLSNPAPAFARLCGQGARSGREQGGRREYVSAPPGPSVKQVQHRLSADQQAELLIRYLAGERAYQLAEAFQVHRSTVAKLLADAGLRRSRSLTPAELAECVELYARGLSCEQIGQRLGRNHGTIWLVLKAEGVLLRQPWSHLQSDPDPGG
jgi:Helix-turn-helix domain